MKERTFTVNDTKSRTCCLIGQRNIPSTEYEELNERLENEIVDLVFKKVSIFCIGASCDFDKIAALTILRVQVCFPHIKLVLVLPSENQLEGWYKDDINLFEEIKSKADKIIFEKHTKDGMIAINHRLVNSSCFCICYLNESMGETADAIEYAKQKILNIVNCAE